MWDVLNEWWDRLHRRRGALCDLLNPRGGGRRRRRRPISGLPWPRARDFHCNRQSDRTMPEGLRRGQRQEAPGNEMGPSGESKRGQALSWPAEDADLNAPWARDLTVAERATPARCASKFAFGSEDYHSRVGDRAAPWNWLAHQGSYAGRCRCPLRGNIHITANTDNRDHPRSCAYALQPDWQITQRTGASTWALSRRSCFRELTDGQTE